MKFTTIIIISTYLYYFCFISLINCVPETVTQKSNFKKPTLNKPHIQQSVSFDFSSTDHIVNESSLNLLLKILNLELTQNTPLFTELINSLFSGFLNQNINLSGHECIPQLQSAYLKKLKKIHKKITSTFKLELSKKDLKNPDKRYEACFDSKQSISEIAQTILSYHIEQIYILQQQKLQIQDNNEISSLITTQLEHNEYKVASTEDKLKRVEMISCNAYSNSNDYFGKLPMISKCDIMMNMIYKYLIYKQKEKGEDIKKLKKEMSKFKKVGKVLYALVTKKYKFHYLGKEIDDKVIEVVMNWLSKAQIAEGKVMKSFALLKNKYPTEKDSIIISNVNYADKRDVVLNLGMAFGILGRAVIGNLA